MTTEHIDISGTEGDDYLQGTSAMELIQGLGGDDILNGDAGPDTLIGGAGNDTLDGSFDSVAVYSGNSSQYTISYAIWDYHWTVIDSVTERDGSDTVLYISNLQFSDKTVTALDYCGEAIAGGGADDLLTGTQLAESISGSQGNDTINAGAGGDAIQMGDGNDLVHAGAGDDSILDNSNTYVGTDVITGNDTVYGEDGNDQYSPSGGTDFFDGGAGRDKIWVGAVSSGDTQGVVANLNTGIADNGRLHLTFINVEDFWAAAGFNDTIIGNAGDNELEGSGGIDSIDGGAGNDSISGNAGVFIGGLGNDTIFSGSGTVYGDDGNDLLVGGSGANLMWGGTGNDTINGGNGNDTLHAEDGNDLLTGGNGNDSIDGGQGIDTARYNSNSRADFSFAGNAHTATMSSLVGTAQTDTLLDVERIFFIDTSVALDLDAHAGSTVRILGALLGADAAHNPSYVGIGLSYFDAGMSETAVSAFASSLFYGGLSDDAYVKVLYTNVIHSAPSQEIADVFIGMLHNGTSRADLLVLAANTSYNENSIGFTGLTETGVAYNPL